MYEKFPTVRPDKITNINTVVFLCSLKTAEAWVNIGNLQKNPSNSLLTFTIYEIRDTVSRIWSSHVIMTLCQRNIIFEILDILSNDSAPVKQKVCNLMAE